MKVYYDEDFETFPYRSDNFRICPEGDYSRVKNIPGDSVFTVFTQKVVRLGGGVAVGGWCSFKGSVVCGDFCTLGSHTDIAGSLHTGAGCKIGRRSRIRGGVFLGAKNKVSELCVFRGAFSDPSASCFFDGNSLLGGKFYARRGYSTLSVYYAGGRFRTAICTDSGFMLYSPEDVGYISFAHFLRKKYRVSGSFYPRIPSLRRCFENLQNNYPGSISKLEMRLIEEMEAT